MIELDLLDISTDLRSWNGLLEILEVVNKISFEGVPSSGIDAEIPETVRMRLGIMVPASIDFHIYLCLVAGIKSSQSVKFFCNFHNISLMIDILYIWRQNYSMNNNEGKKR